MLRPPRQQRGRILPVAEVCAGIMCGESGTAVEEIEFRPSELRTQQDIVLLSEALERGNAAAVTRIRVILCQPNIDSWRQFCKSLLRCCKLQKIALESCSLPTEDHVNLLANVLRDCTGLSSLSLKHTQISIASGPSIRRLLTTKRGAPIAQLCLAGVSVPAAGGMDSILKGITESQSVSSLILGGCLLGEAAATSLSTALAAATPGSAGSGSGPCLRTLVLDSTSIGEDGGRGLVALYPIFSGCQNLASLQLRACRIGHWPQERAAREHPLHGLTDLLRQPWCKLRSLDLSLNPIRQDDIAVLAPGLAVNASLSHLRLVDTSLGWDGIAVLARGLQSCKSIAFLDLQDSW